MTFTLVDLVQDEDEYVFNLLVELERDIRKDDHRNRANYFNIHKKISEFMSFEVLINDDWDEIVAISGLYNNGWYPTNHARALTRTYYVPKYRNHSLWSFNKGKKNAWAEDYFFPYEVAKAQNLGVDVVFFSIEYLARRKAITSLSEALRAKYGWEWTVGEGMFNTCRQHNDAGQYIGVNPSASCWQNCSYLLLNKDATFDLPNMSIDEWNNKFRNDQNSRIR